MNDAWTFLPTCWKRSDQTVHSFPINVLLTTRLKINTADHCGNCFNCFESVMRIFLALVIVCVLRDANSLNRRFSTQICPYLTILSWQKRLWRQLTTNFDFFLLVLVFSSVTRVIIQISISHCLKWWMDRRVNEWVEGLSRKHTYPWSPS